ncbi:MAG TPA: fumarylacetoacetate hydrolase family protein [Candidatus Binatia bacterium]|nr:fumarylacetoacetate hydrolase family protein [Candidatus Binatia bacterium]
MGKIARIAGAGLLAAVLLGLAASFWVSRPLYPDRLDDSALADIAIASPDRALTFARIEVDGQPRVLLVTGWHGGRVTGVDLSQRLGATETSPLPLLQRVGYGALLEAATSIAGIVAVDPAQLIAPFDAPEQNIGVGFGYPEHARESGFDAPPFLFPKFAAPTAWNTTLPASRAARLDYEAELGFVAMGELASPVPAVGFVLCNEVTDRWPLAKNFRRGAPMGTTGFADGKSGAGFAPVGPLLVVPRDAQSFYRDLELRLYLNGRLRQHARAADLRWGPREALAAIFRGAQQPYRYGQREVLLLGYGVTVPAGTIVFSGTPAGVLFKTLNLWNPWAYLRPGDEVVIHADLLGIIRNRVVE